MKLVMHESLKHVVVKDDRNRCNRLLNAVGITPWTKQTDCLIRIPGVEEPIRSKGIIYTSHMVTLFSVN